MHMRRRSQRPATGLRSSAGEGALCHQSPLQTATHPSKGAKVGGRSSFLLLVCLKLRRQRPSSCTAAGKGCARRATCDHMDAVCVSVCRLPGTPPSTAATCLSRLAGAPCPDIIDMSHYSRRDREAFARSGELKQQLQGWHGQLSDMAVCISINGHPDHESTASRLSIRAASSQPGCAHASTLCGSTLAWTLQGLLQSFHGPGCRLHILRCEPRCAMMHVSAVVIRCKSSLSRTVSPAHQDACRCRYVLSV